MKDQFSRISKSVVFAYFTIGISALLYMFGLQSLMSAAKTLPAGLGAFAQLPGILDESLAKYFSFFYLALNVPLMVMFARKIKPKFMLRTSFFLLITTIVGALQFISTVDKFFTHSLQQLIIKQDGYPTLEQATYHLVWPMLVLPAIAGAMVGLAIALSWKYGGSTGGTDIVTYYFSTKKKRQIGTVSMIVSFGILITTFGIFLGLNNTGIKSVWFASIAGSMIYIVISGLVVNTVYPKYKKVAVEIHTIKVEEISTWMNSNCIHAYRVESSFWKYEKKQKQHIVTVMLLLETKSFVKAIKKIDSEAWITVTRIEAIFGSFDTSPVE